MINRWLLLGVLFCAPLFSIHAQITDHYDSAFTYREVVDEICDDPNNMCHYNKEVSWNDSQIQEYTYRRLSGSNVIEFMNWRMVFPANYDPNRTEGYPVILMLHGGGESGRKWGGTTFLPTEDRFDNNGKNLIHGGQAHLNAVNRNPALPNAFPGIVIWPQVSYNGAWESGWENGNLSANARMTIQILEWVIQRYNVDPDRISMHGLSNGAKGSWDLASKRPDLFAAVLPMSGVGSNLEPMTDALVTTPLWLFQGGTDTNPRQQAAEDWIAKLLEKGAAPRYTLYPNLGHGVWNTAYAESDFWSWMLAQDKKNIYVFGGDPNICPEGSVKLGISENFAEYQWRKNGVPIPGATTRFLTVTDPDTYDVQFKRQFGPDVWVTSNALVVGEKGGSTFSPTLTNTGSVILPIKNGATNLGGVQNVITFTTDPGYSTYYWFKNGNPMDPPTTSLNTRSVSNNHGLQTDAGEYTVKVLEGTGCISTPSNAITVTWNDPQPTTPAIAAPTVPYPSSSPTEMLVSWIDYPNETEYELWRYRHGSLGYPEIKPVLIAVLPAGTTSFQDKGLRPEALYKYNIRAILPGSSGGIFSPQSQWGTTNEDNVAPTTPTNLIASDITDTEVTLSWDPSTDNDLIYKYDIYNGSQIIHTIEGSGQGTVAPLTTYAVNGLAPNSWNYFSVRAQDFKGNYSPISEGVEVTTQGAANGLIFNYYTTSGLSGSDPLKEPGGFNFNQTPTQTGVVSNFDISDAFIFQNTTNPDNFVFSFDGYIQIDNPGNYRFYTSSDDGSRLYIDGTELIDNDGANGTITVSGVRNLTVGKHSIRVTYFENGGGNILGVKYNYTSSGTPTNNYGSASFIPDNKLFQSGATILTYYLKTGSAGDDPSIYTAWTTSEDGTGGTTAPSNAFNNPLSYFTLANRSTVTLYNSWTISGSGSKVIVGDGVMLNLNDAFVGKMDAESNATINVNHATLPQFNLLDPASTVNFDIPGSTNIPLANYGNVNMVSTQLYNLPASSTTIKGNLTIENGVTTSGLANNLSTLRIGGDLIVNNTSGNPFPAASANQYSLVFTGGNSHTVSFENPINPNLFSIQADYGDSVAFSNLSGNTFTVGSSKGGGLLLKGGASLNLGNNNLVVTGRGTINPNNETGDLIMDGGNFSLNTTATQNSGIYFAGSNLNNFTTSTPKNNRVSLLSPVIVKNLVTVDNGELNADIGSLVLRSTSDDSSGTARIGPLLNGAKVTGSITAERYMSGEGRIYRYISSPVKGTTAEDLQAFFPITGHFADSSSGPGLLTNASMFTYSEPTYSQFPAVGGTNLDTLRRGKGYVPFIREASDSTLWKVTGEVYQGDIPFDLTGTGVGLDGWNLLGNPYPAPIKWTGSSTGGWTLSDVNSTVYILENSNAIGGGSRWQSYNGLTSMGTFDGIIAPGQAFWVRTTTSNPQLIIHENAKQVTDAAFFRTSAPNNALEIVMTSPSEEDATFIGLFEGATTAFDTNIDGVKRDNGYFNLSSLTSDGKAMVINLTTTEFCVQEFKLRTANAPAESYSLTINGADRFTSHDKITLIDSFTQTEKVIDASETISFAISSNPDSKKDGRFVIRIERPEVNLQTTLKSETLCDETTAMIKVLDAQEGVYYQAFHNEKAISEALMGHGGTLELPVSSDDLIQEGSITATVNAGFKGCNSVVLSNAISVSKDAFTPEVLVESGQLVASIEADQYQWYYQDEKLEGETGKNLTSPQEGNYYVEATINSCTLKSENTQFRVTGLEESALQNALYPNPTNGKVVVTHSGLTNSASIRVISTMGQVQSVPVTAIDHTHTEVDLGALPPGLYVVLLNGKNYRVIKE